jgi:hypothetical protein
VPLGIAMLVIGIAYRIMFMRGLRLLRRAMAAHGLVHAESGFPPSVTPVTAVLLLLGIAAIVSIEHAIGPSGDPCWTKVQCHRHRGAAMILPCRGAGTAGCGACARRSGRRHAARRARSSVRVST